MLVPISKEVRHGPFDKDRTVVSIKNRMKRLGIDLDRYIGRITNTWASTPAGFGFTCTDKKAYLALMAALVQNRHFGSDSMVGGSQHTGASFRECGQADSLHVVLSTRPDKAGATCSIHLDSVSVATGVDPKTLQVIYDPGKVLQHLATDLLHTPLIMPSSKGGIVFGFRF
jgi:hypothetical protein